MVVFRVHRYQSKPSLRNVSLFAPTATVRLNSASTKKKLSNNYINNFFLVLHQPTNTWLRTIDEVRTILMNDPSRMALEIMMKDDKEVAQASEFTYSDLSV